MKWIITIAALALAACAGVRPQDLAEWEGQPVEMLDKQPVFLVMQLVKTYAADGTEIRNYVNGRSVASCSQNGFASGNTLNYAAYNQFMSCSAGFAACNNIFYIKNGRVLRYTPIGTGGMGCMTAELTRPNFAGPANL